MGDRGNIAVKMNDDTIFFYTHWRGYKVTDVLADALHRGMSRWDDPAYLARIIFCSLMGDSDVSETTGFGISNIICDNQYPIPTVHATSVPQFVEYEGMTYSYPMFIQKFKKEN